MKLSSLTDVCDRRYPVFEEIEIDSRHFFSYSEFLEEFYIFFHNLQQIITYFIVYTFLSAKQILTYKKYK